MPEIARDYHHALRLISASPGANFRVTADGGIRKESGIRLPSFGDRRVQQLQYDAEVGKALLFMFGKAAMDDRPADSTDLINPRQLAVASRFMAAYDQLYGRGSANVSGRDSPKLAERKPSQPDVSASLESEAISPSAHQAEEHGQHLLGLARQALRDHQLTPDQLKELATTYRFVAEDFRACDLQYFQRYMVSNGAVPFRVFYDHPQWCDRSNFAAFVADPKQAKEYERAAKTCSLNLRLATPQYDESDLGPDALNMDRVTPEAFVALRRGLEARSAAIEAEPLDMLISKAGTHCLLRLFNYLDRARANGLTVEQAMVPINLWQGESADMIKAYWKKQPEQAPNQQLLTEALDAVTAGRALTEPQAQEIFTYIEPKFHSAPA